MRIMIVDDSGMNREILRRNLHEEGVETLEAEDGLLALEILKTSKPDAIVSDILMPNMDGYSLCRAVRADPDRKDIPFIIYTSTYISPEDETLAERCGADKYIQKPAPFGELFGAIRGLVDKKAARKPAEPAPPSEETVLKQYSQVLIRKLEKKNLELQKRGDALQRMWILRDTFGYFATPEVADFIMSHPLDYWKRCERRVLTVLFADIRQFTPFMEASSPEEAIAAITGIFEQVDEAVRLEGGILNKFMGDGVLAIFGAPLENKDHAASAARAALRMKKAAETLDEARARAGLRPLRLGIGINTGEAVAGCLGTKARTEYTVIGHTVNLGARIEQLAAPGQILLGPATAERLGGNFRLESRGAAALRGVAQPVELWELLGESGAPDGTGPELPELERGPLVSREKPPGPGEPCAGPLRRLAHDLRSPLSALNAFLGFLGTDAQGALSGRAAEDLEGALKAAEKMTGLLNGPPADGGPEEGKMNEPGGPGRKNG